eukprot:SAG11_NODE_34259_length_273_cov_0.580460_1_plen_50_part_10
MVWQPHVNTKADDAAVTAVVPTFLTGIRIGVKTGGAVITGGVSALCSAVG